MSDARIRRPPSPSTPAPATPTTAPTDPIACAPSTTTPADDFARGRSRARSPVAAAALGLPTPAAGGSALRLERMIDGRRDRTEPLNSATLRRASAKVRQFHEQVTRDPIVRQVANLVQRTAGQREPVRVLFTDGVGAYFKGGDSPLIVIDSSRADTQGMDALRHSLTHELGHYLSYRLYGDWIAQVNYGFDGAHTNGEETNAQTAWTEGFAEAFAHAFNAPQARVAFDTRQDAYLDDGWPRSTNELLATEGVVRCALTDFWKASGPSAGLLRTLEVMRLQGSDAKHERHLGLLPYVREHVQRHPEDLLRWSAVLWGNTFLTAEVGDIATLDQRQQADYGRLADGLRTLGKTHGAAVVSKALQDLLHGAAPLPAQPSELLRSVQTQVQRLVAAGGRVLPGMIEGSDRDLSVQGRLELRAKLLADSAGSSAKGVREAWHKAVDLLDDLF